MSMCVYMCVWSPFYAKPLCMEALWRTLGICKAPSICVKSLCIGASWHTACICRKKTEMCICVYKAPRGFMRPPLYRDSVCTYIYFSSFLLLTLCWPWDIFGKNNTLTYILNENPMCTTFTVCYQNVFSFFYQYFVCCCKCLHSIYRWTIN